MGNLNEISFYSILLPSGMVFFSWKRLSQPYRIISILILSTLVMDSIAFTLYKFGINNMILFRVFTYVEAILLIVYFHSIYDSLRLRRFCLIMLAGFLIFSVSNLFPWNWELFAHHNSIQRGVECIWAILLFVVFYINLFAESKVTNLLRYPHYWMTSGFLMYFSGTIFQSILTDTYQNSELIGFDLAIIHSILNIFLNIIYTIVLWMGSRELSSEQ